ncbi:MAG: MotA/TolQ/ExbB proton channel family protein [Gemmatimonadales bacterium]
MTSCPNCGTATPADQPYCLVCGAEIAAAKPDGSGAAGPRPAAPGLPAGARPDPHAGRRVVRQGPAAIVPFALGAAATVVLEHLVALAVPVASYVHRRVRPQGGRFMSIGAGLTVFAFFWACADLFFKFRIARVNESDLARSEIARLPAMVAQEPTAVTLHRLRSWDGRMLARPVGRRVQWLLQHLETTDSQRAHELIRHQSDLEADHAASSYRVVKLLIWAMPILGFIGTVLGISLAVGGFSQFLTTSVSIEDVQRVTTELGEVAGGLSFAFDTTLIGLVGGLVASVLSTGVQGREERVLTRVEELGLRVMESALPADRNRQIAELPLGAPGEEFEKLMRARLQDLSKQMDQFTKAVRVGLDGFLGEWAKLPPEVERVAADMGGLRQHLATAAESTDQLILETRVLLEGIREASARMSTGLEASIGSVSATVEVLGTELHGIAESLTKSVDALSQRVTAEDAMKKLNASIAELASRMNDLSTTQASLAPVLYQLAGPLELRLVPGTRPAPNANG